MSSWKIACACGWETTGTESEVVAATQEHGRSLHNMDLDHSQAMAMAVPLESES